MFTAANRAQNLSGIARGVFDRVLVSPPNVTKKPKDIFEQFVRDPEQIATFDGGWKPEISDRVVPGLASILKFARRRSVAVVELTPLASFVRGRKGVAGRRGRYSVQPEQAVLFLRGRRGGQGKGIAEASLDNEGHLVIKYTDDTEWRSEQSLRGRGIEEASIDLEDHLVLQYSDGTVWRSEQSLRGLPGPEGPQGLPGISLPGKPGRGIHDVKLTKEGYLWFEFTDVTYWNSSPVSLFGGPPGKDGARGRSVLTDIQNLNLVGRSKKVTQHVNHSTLLSQDWHLTQRHVRQERNAYTQILDARQHVQVRQQLVTRVQPRTLVEHQQFYGTVKHNTSIKKTAVHIERPIQFYSAPTSRLERRLADLEKVVRSMQQPAQTRLLVQDPARILVVNGARILL